MNTTGGLACLGKCMHLVSDGKVCLLEFACGSSCVVNPAELRVMKSTFLCLLSSVWLNG